MLSIALSIILLPISGRIERHSFLYENGTGSMPTKQKYQQNIPILPGCLRTQKLFMFMFILSRVTKQR